MPKKISLVGRTFGRLKVIADARPRREGKLKKLRSYSVCLCECGVVKEVLNVSLSFGNTQSCGCLCSDTMSKTMLKHGMSNTPTYYTWSGMHERCGNPNHIAFKHYGGNGITICERWNSFGNFFDDMGIKPKGKTLERMLSSGNYCPENCCWATHGEQNRNTTRNRNFTICGITGCLTDLCKHFGIEFGTAHARIFRSKWNPEKAFLTPVSHKRILP